MNQPIPLEAEKTYHIYTHANGSENLFRTAGNYYYFLKKYSQYIYPIAETFAYCLMPNHFHLMVRVRSENELLTLPGFGTLEGLDVSKAVSRKFSHLFNKRKDLTGFENLSGLISRRFSNFLNAYAKAYNEMFNRRGSLFERPFKRKLIENDAYFSALITYIHNNPIHHGFVKDLNDWPHSSWLSYISDKPTRIAREEGISWFGNKQEFLKFHQEFEKKDVMLEFE